MVVRTYACNSCAVAEIGGLGSHKDALEAMRFFCRANLGVKDNFICNYAKLTCYYMFCAGPEVRSDEVGGSHHSVNHWPRYGTEFAQFITDNKLGEVVTVGPKKNFKHHESSTAQAWLWSPDQAALEKWWDKTQKVK